MFSEAQRSRVFAALDSFHIEIPSWGFANTGTRFGKFVQSGAATTLEEKFADAGEVHRLTGVTPTLALHVLWDLPRGLADVDTVKQLAEKHSVRPGSINPNVFQDQQYKFGSICNPSADIREQAIQHLVDSAAIAEQLGSREISLWIADGSNYPGSQSMRKRIGWLNEAMQRTHAALGPEQIMLIEYKPFEPAFYHTDIADWGMACELARNAGPKAKVLVDTGHHYQSTNIEQIVAWLLQLDKLGGFHFNDRKYADDDLTLGSIDPYQVFRIFHELFVGAAEGASTPAFMIDQSHNLKGKMEAVVQSVCTAQELYAKAALVDLGALAALQQSCKIVDAEELYRGAFWEDVRPLVHEWREHHGLPSEPLQALRKSGYEARNAEERGAKNSAAQSAYA